MGDDATRAEQLLDTYRVAEADDLVAAYNNLAAEERAAHAGRLLVLSVIDERGRAAVDGATDTAAWVAMTDHARPTTAGREVRTARKLAGLPAIADVALQGRLSPDQLAPLVSVADASSDRRWAADGPRYEPGELERLAQRQRQQRRRVNDNAAAVEARRGVRVTERGAESRVEVRGPAADIHALLNELERRAEAEGPDAEGTWRPRHHRLFDALTAMARQHLGDHANVDRATVVIHGTLDALKALNDNDDNDSLGWAELTNGTAVASDTLRRLACDCKVQLAIIDDRNRLQMISETQRIVPWSLRRIILHRDRATCRWPGCCRTLGIEVHHLQGWPDGKTEQANLACLCLFHHHLVHEGRWQLTGDPSRPDGLTAKPPDRPPLPGVPPGLLTKLSSPVVTAA